MHIILRSIIASVVTLGAVCVNAQGPNFTGTWVYAAGTPPASDGGRISAGSAVTDAAGAMLTVTSPLLRTRPLSRSAAIAYSGSAWARSPRLTPGL